MDLKQIWDLKAEMTDAQARLSEVVDALQNITPPLDGLPKSQSVTDRLSKLVAMKIELETRINELQTEINSVRAEMTAAIVMDTNLTAPERQVLRRRYCDCEHFKTIARAMKFSQNNIFVIHRKALKKLSAV